MKFSDARGGDETATSSALRAFALIEQIAIADVPPTLEELTSASGLPKPTAFRILRLLMDNGLVERELRGKRYAVGPRLCALSLSVQMRSPRRRERQAILARLVDAIGETCNLTMLDGKEVVYVDRVETSANVRLHMQAGSRVPLHCTASGKLLLAQMAPE
ncbi:MAG TPA: helix-turn-helix domain-containing protein, partial [Candidatus Binatus sp.]|nr:helix-turn-helix domain-containing protein [Candidatus Binatus sp.]